MATKTLIRKDFFNMDVIIHFLVNAIHSHGYLFGDFNFFASKDKM
jgi:hypothetical protein